MNILIPEGLKEATMTWALFVWKFFTLTLFGLFNIPMAIWGYTKVLISHRIVGKRSYFSGDGAAIVAVPDNKHPGRFNFYASVIEKNNQRSELVCSGYNGRKYSYKIDRHKNAWAIMIDGHNVYMEVENTPIFTYNLPPKLSAKMTIEKEVEITL